MRYIIALVLAILPATALAQWPQQQYTQVQSQSVSTDPTNWQMACRVKVTQRGAGNYGSGSVGSGVYFSTESVDGRNLAYILTAAHMFRDDPQGDVWCSFPLSREEKQGSLVEINTAEDWAIVMLLSPPAVKHGKLALQPPGAGDAVTLVGFGGVPRKGFRAAATRVRANTTDGDALAGLPSSQGDSGGPVFDANGRICGIISATDDNETVVCCGFLRRLSNSICGPSGCVPQPRQQPPQTIPVVPQTAPVVPQINQTVVINYQQLVEQMKADKEFLIALQGKQGDQGPQGPKGDRGEPGPQGPAGTVDVTDLELAIEQVLASKGITVRTIDTQGNVRDSEFIPLGGTLNLLHKPIK